MSITLKDAVDFLLSNGYAFRYGQRIKFHNKFYVEMGQMGMTADAKPLAVVDWVRLFTKFIMDAEVPKRAESARGDYYSVNQYSEPAMKAFRKLIEQGIGYDDLVASTKLYYKSGVRLKVKISRYIEEGIWRTDYDNYMASKEAGDLSEHVKTEMSNGTTSWSVG